MKVDIYESIEKQGRYFVVPSGLATSILPERVNPTKKKSIATRFLLFSWLVPHTNTLDSVHQHGHMEDASWHGQ